jgi:signal transduction histidine kinase
MSHELRTPLNAILGFTGTLLMRLPGPLTEEQANQLEIVQSSARHLLSLINDMLDVARIESGKADLHFEEVEAGAVVDTVVTALRPAAENKGLSLKAEMPADELTLTTDRRALRQILNNLVGNAIKYTEKGSVRVRALRDADGSIAIAVTDTGIGIKSEDRQRLFKAFEQLDRSTTRRFEGVGLGLHLSNKLAALIRAELTVESEPGKGSTFTLKLPGK